jgi:hypothetical protein
MLGIELRLLYSFVLGIRDAPSGKCLYQAFLLPRLLVRLAGAVYHICHTLDSLDPYRGFYAAPKRGSHRDATSRTGHGCWPSCKTVNNTLALKAASCFYS